MKKAITQILLFILSTGWLVPLAMSFWFFSSWANKIVMPKLYNEYEPIHSLPFLASSEASFIIAFTWLSAAIVGWAGYLLFYKPFLRSRSSGDS